MFRIMKKNIGLIVVSLCLLLGMPFEALADTKPIKSVSIKISSKVEAGDSLPEIGIESTSGDGVQVSTGSSYYTIVDAEWADKKSDATTIGSEPRMTVTLGPEDVSDHYFLANYKSSSVSVSGGTFVSARRDGNNLVVTLRLKPLKGEYDSPQDIFWNDSNLGEIRWEEGENKSGYYEVQLLRDGKNVQKIEKTSSKNYNFYPYMTKAGDYTVKIRSIPGTDAQAKYGKRSEWLESGELHITDRYVSDGKGQQAPNSTAKKGTQETVGWFKEQNIWKYRYPDGRMCMNGWFDINGLWYFFDGNANMLTGWIEVGGQKYYLNQGGDMAVGWVRPDNVWYYFRPEAEGQSPVGSMVSSGWRIINGYYYYFNQDGSLYTGWLEQNGKWYYLNALDNSLQGALFTGWIRRDGKTYFTDSNGEMVEGWYEIDGHWYYFYPGSGEMAHDTQINGMVINSDGIWQ